MRYTLGPFSSYPRNTDSCFCANRSGAKNIAVLPSKLENVRGQQLENTDSSSLLGPPEETSMSPRFGNADGCADAASSPFDTSHLDGFDICGMGEGAELDTDMGLNCEVWRDLYPVG